ncbi:OprO/OprP family phosphate-selective porin [Colwellia sp. E2M01]|uniref:OprO/OprP family phosphate-selective porin n=1 Tax=Colwellia sp. E2M01 TaxID=2841561 RepID=UPI001C09206D|nr:OprO/OprP family phosphate-selective porin [Colwellia sp. E2M01]MBU2871827.1 OprO/OprP family phosphate-selective porin [Colwellia sp. E2M01]
MNTPFIAQAEETKPDIISIEEAWRFTDIYDNAQGDYIKLSGRLQLDAAWVNSDQGKFNDTLWRRFRFGFKGKKNNFSFDLEADINLNNQLSDAYNRLTDANIGLAVNKHTKILFLKQSAGFTLDGKTSSKKTLTPERNNLTNNLWFTAEYFTGISITSTFWDDFSYKAGVFASDGSDEISITDASYFTLFTISKKLVNTRLWDEGEISIDYVYNDNHDDANTKDFSQIVSSSSKFSLGNWGLQNDISWAAGDLNQSNVFGLVVMPTYMQNEAIQWVTRYTYINSAQANGISLNRYENSVLSDRGDQYQEVYGGVNWFFNAHKLKLQTGIQYAKMDDAALDGGKYRGWGFSLALRSYW